MKYIDKYERDIVKVPINLLRFRKNNGRIASDVLHYEHTSAPLDESDDEVQKLLANFLLRKDPEKTDILTKNILHSGQREAAIITCDGFLIDGNRRKMVMDRLRDQHKDDERFRYMKVVILPARGDDGGPPTVLEIEKLENRYQLQSEGKSEYYGFDRALSIRRKIQLGLTLEEQISDDPQYANATNAEIQKAMREINRDYLDPLRCVDRYLSQFNRDHQYHTVSSRIGDRQGRWQAFLEYSKTYNSTFLKDKFRLENRIREDEIGDIEEAAFDIIRLRKVPGMPKVHQIMRDVPKYCGNHEAKKELLNIPKTVDPVLSTAEQFRDPQQKIPLSTPEADAKWAAKNIQSITFHLKRASNHYNSQKEKETPVGLLQAALKKLTHDDMDMTTISANDYKRARLLTTEIQTEAKGLEKELFEQQKKLRKLVKKK